MTATRRIWPPNASSHGGVESVSRVRDRRLGAPNRGFSWLWSVAFIAVVGAVAATCPGCRGRDDEPRVGSETNFLMHCSGDCGDGLTCLCGTCTRACTGTVECSAMAPEAECVSIPDNLDSGASCSCAQGATCDLKCVSDDDCGALGDQYRCEAGFCRKGELVCPAVVLPPGDQVREIVVDGITRSYLLHVPASYRGDTPVPLVVDFHPMGIGAAWERDNSGYRDVSDQQGFIAVWPEGLDGTWDVGPCCALSTPVDDLSFAVAIVRQLSTQACLDPRRLHATGLSQGGMMAYYLACQHAETFASVSVSSMDLLVDSELGCNPSRPVTEISFRGAADTVVPYAGGPSSPPSDPDTVHELMGAVGTFQKWAQINRCTGEPTAEDADGCSTYSTCEDGTEVTLCTIADGGQVIGDVNRAWQTLANHPMP